MNQEAGVIGAWHATRGETGRVKGADEVTIKGESDVVILVLQGGPGRIDNERRQDGNRNNGLHPPAVLPQGGLVGTSPCPTEHYLSRTFYDRHGVSSIPNYAGRLRIRADAEGHP